MAGHDDLRVQFGGSGDGGVEIVDLKPEEYAVTVWLRSRVTDRAVVVLDVPAV
jgi:hypothetical protein